MNKQEYEYLPIKEAKPGDIVQYVKDLNGPVEDLSIGSLYIITENSGILLYVNSSHDGWQHERFKLLKTKPGTKAKTDNTVMAISKEYSATYTVGKTYTVKKWEKAEVARIKLNEIEGRIWKPEHFVVLCIKETAEKPIYNDDYYEYFQKLYNAGVKLEHTSSISKNSGWISTTLHCPQPSIIKTTVPFKYRLANRQTDEPEPNTKAYIDYWETKYAAGENVWFYRATTGQKCKVRNMNKKPHYIFFIKQQISIQLS